MQVRELIQLAKFLKKTVEEADLPSHYQQLIQAVDQAAQDQNPQEVDEQLNRLKTLHTEAEKTNLSIPQRKLLDHFGGRDLIGQSAIHRLDSAFEKHKAHPQGLTAALNEMASETEQLRDRAHNLIQAVEPMLSDLVEEEVKENEGRLWLSFADNSNVNTIDDLEKTAATWKLILHHFSRMPNASTPGGRILQIQKHSPLELEVAANLALLVPLGFGITFLLSRLEQVVHILQQVEVLKQMKVKTATIEALRDEANERREQMVSDAAEQVKEEFDTGEEERTAAALALEQILIFLLDGGELDIDTGEDKSEVEQENNGDDSNARKQLRGYIESIRQEMKLLSQRQLGGEGSENTDEGK